MVALRASSRNSTPEHRHDIGASRTPLYIPDIRSIRNIRKQGRLSSRSKKTDGPERNQSALERILERIRDLRPAIHGCTIHDPQPAADYAITRRASRQPATARVDS